MCICWPVVNWPFIFWNTGSWAVACARRARDSEAALENMVETLETFSKPTPNVLTSFFTKFSVCGVILASDTAPLFSNATEWHLAKPCWSCRSTWGWDQAVRGEPRNNKLIVLYHHTNKNVFFFRVDFFFLLFLHFIKRKRGLIKLSPSLTLPYSLNVPDAEGCPSG